MNPFAPAPDTAHLRHAADGSVRMAHFSDVHITVRKLGFGLRDLASKRITGWLNLKVLGRGFRFRQADAIASHLLRDVEERRPDHLIFSGDATMMAFEAEFAAAAECLGVTRAGLPPGIAVPGNHDYYLRASPAAGLFERHFAPWQQGVRFEGTTYPFVQRVGPVHLIGVCSAIPTFWSWDASGLVDPDQCERLRRLLADLPPGPRVIVTHYPVYLPGHKPEIRWRRLRNWREVVRLCADGGVSLWVHGHRHNGYYLPPSEKVPFPLVCAGSATQHHRWAYNEYVFRGDLVEVHRRSYSRLKHRFVEHSRFDVPLAAC